MRNTWLIIRREYLERVRTRAFIVSTILLPAFMFGVTILPSMLASRKSKSARHLVVAASDQSVADAIAKQLSSSDNDNTYAPETRVATEATQQELNQAVSSGAIDGYLWVTNDAIASGKVTFTAANTSDFVESGELRGAVNSGVRRARLQARGLSPAETDEILKSVKIESIQMEGGKQKSAGGIGSFFAAFGLAFTLYMMLIMYGMATMRSVLEEKTSRVMEVMLSSVHVEGTDGPYAALGAMVNSEQEAQQFQWFVTMPLIIPIVTMTAVIRQPDSAFATWMSMVPFFSPILMYVRMVSHMPRPWQIWLSIALLIATTYLVVALCSRIYRVGILMYGKRPTLPEIVKWVRYA